MKKSIGKYIMLVATLLIVFLTPKVFAEEGVFIEEITLVEHSATATEKSVPSKDGLNLGFDLSFSQVDDFAKYKIVVNNPTETSYELNKDIDFKSSEYLEYKVEFENDNNIIEGNQKLTLFVTITYKNLVPSTMLIDGKLIENNTLSLNLSNDTGDTIVNPSTVDRVVLYVFTLIITSGFSLVFYRITKNKKYLSIFVLGLVLIPFEAYALEKLEFKIETKVVIEEKYYVRYLYYDTIKTSEKGNYELFENDGFCTAIPNTEYEYCYVVYTDPVPYAKGDQVPLLESIENRYLNEDGELTSQTFIMDDVLRSHVLFGDTEFYNYSESFSWYYEVFGAPEGDDPYQTIFNENDIVTVSVDDDFIYVKTPSTFKMQGHDMYFELINLLSK